MHKTLFYILILFLQLSLIESTNPLKGHYKENRYPDGLRVVIPYNDHTLEVYGKNHPDDDMFILEGKFNMGANYDGKSGLGFLLEMDNYQKGMGKVNARFDGHIIHFSNGIQWARQ